MRHEQERFFIRTDGNEVIGAGHLMRCITIAEALARLLGNRDKICFLTAEERSEELLRSRLSGQDAPEDGGSFQIVTLGTDYRHMEEELPALESMLRRETSEVCILVDSYFVTDVYLRNLRRYGRVWLLDDMEQHAFPVDGVINYNCYASVEKYQRLYQGGGTRYCLGSRYVPVRSQFQKAAYVLRPEVKDILVTAGGGNAGNVVPQLLKTLFGENCHFHVALGRFHTRWQEWGDWERKSPRIHLYVDVKDMASLMRKCDLAVTAAGTTVYELAAVGLPFVCFSCAENQERLAEYMGEKGIGGYVGAYHREPVKVLDRLREQVRELRENYSLREAYQKEERKLVDGRGADRIAQLLAE